MAYISHKSASIYAKQYESFTAWCQNNNMDQITEDVLVAYISEKAETYKSPTLWSTYSMLKSTLLANDNVDITKFKGLLDLIKSKSVGYKSKQSNIFKYVDIRKFITEAPDYNYLMWKLCLIFGIAGGCRKEDLKNMSSDNIQDKGNILIVRVPNSKTGTKTFTISDRICDNVNPIELYRKYVALRPAQTAHKCLFVFYRNGKCSVQPVGINTFGKIPKWIAEYLNLPDAGGYTGYTFRRTSPCILENADAMMMRENEGWNTAVVKRKREAVASMLDEKRRSSLSEHYKNVQPLASTSVQKSTFKHNKNKTDIRNSDEDSMNEEVYSSEEDNDIEGENYEIKNTTINVTDTKIQFNRDESEKNRNLTAMECDLFGDYISKHLQQLPADIALNLQSGIHDLVMRTRLEYVRQHPLEAPMMVKREAEEEKTNTIPFVSMPNNKNTSNICRDKRIRDSKPPDPNKRLKKNNRDTDLLTTGQANHRIDVDVFAKHITVQLEKLPENLSLQLQSDIYNLIQEACNVSLMNIGKDIEGNCMNIKIEDSPDLIENDDILL